MATATYPRNHQHHLTWADLTSEQRKKPKFQHLKNRGDQRHHACNFKGCRRVFPFARTDYESTLVHKVCDTTTLGPDPERYSYCLSEEDYAVALEKFSKVIDAKIQANPSTRDYWEQRLRKAHQTTDSNPVGCYERHRESLAAEKRAEAIQKERVRYARNHTIRGEFDYPEHLRQLDYSYLERQQERSDSDQADDN